MAPGIPLYIYTNKSGWSPHIHSEMEISKALAVRAISLINRTKGTIEISQCPFPRHAIVFFDTNGKPIASVNVCFECGDILVWPPYFKFKQQEKEKYSLLNPQTEEPLILKAYDEVYPLWMDLFGNDLNMQINFEKLIKWCGQVNLATEFQRIHLSYFCHYLIRRSISLFEIVQPF